MTTGKRYDFLLKQMKDRESGVESLESTSQAPVVIGKEKPNLESRIETEEARVKSLDSASQEPGVAGKKEENLESRVETEEVRVKSLDTASQEPKIKRKKTRRPESRIENLDSDALDEAIEEAKKRPKLGIYSPIVAAILRYRALTTPRYSMGLEMKTIVEQALKSAYPELYEEAQKRMNNLESRQ
jgi:hypothetical protein